MGSSWDSAMFDADGDGDLDIYVAQHHNQQNRLWINDGLRLTLPLTILWVTSEHLDIRLFLMLMVMGIVIYMSVGP
jgi:hypothetical protein